MASNIEKFPSEVEIEEARILANLESLREGFLISGEEGRQYPLQALLAYVNSLPSSPVSNIKEYYLALIPLLEEKKLKDFDLQIKEVHEQQKNILDHIKRNEVKIKSIEDFINRLKNTTTLNMSFEKEITDFIKPGNIELPGETRKRIESAIASKNTDELMKVLAEGALKHINTKKKSQTDSLEEIVRNLDKLKENQKKLQDNLKANKLDDVKKARTNLNKFISHMEKAQQLQANLSSTNIYLYADYLKRIKDDYDSSEKIINELAISNFYPAVNLAKANLDPGDPEDRSLITKTFAGAKRGFRPSQLKLADFAMRSFVQAIAGGSSNFDKYTQPVGEKYTERHAFEFLKKALDDRDPAAIDLTARFIRDYPGIEALFKTMVNIENVKKEEGKERGEVQRMEAQWTAANETLTAIKNLFPENSDAYKRLSELQALMSSTPTVEWNEALKKSINAVEELSLNFLKRLAPTSSHIIQNTELASMNLNLVLFKMKDEYTIAINKYLKEASIAGKKSQEKMNKIWKEKIEPLQNGVFEIDAILIMQGSFQDKLSASRKFLNDTTKITKSFKHDSRFYKIVNKAIEFINKFFLSEDKKLAAIPTFREKVVKRASAIMGAGTFMGVAFDHFKEEEAKKKKEKEQTEEEAKKKKEKEQTTDLTIPNNSISISGPGFEAFITHKELAEYSISMKGPVKVLMSANDKHDAVEAAKAFLEQVPEALRGTPLTIHAESEQEALKLLQKAKDETPSLNVQYVQLGSSIKPEKASDMFPYMFGSRPRRG